MWLLRMSDWVCMVAGRTMCAVDCLELIYLARACEHVSKYGIWG